MKSNKILLLSGSAESSTHGYDSEHGSTAAPPLGTGTGTGGGSASSVSSGSDSVATKEAWGGSNSPEVGGSGARSVNFAIAGGGSGGSEGSGGGGVSRDSSQSRIKPQLFTIGEIGETGESTVESATSHGITLSPLTTPYC